MIRLRDERGKMLVLVALVIVLICAVVLTGIVFTTLISQHSRAQYNVDGMALSMAKRLNENDRVGQINQLVARNRELVFTARQDMDACQETGLALITPLCQQFLDEAYAGQALMESERVAQIDLVSKDIRKSVREYNGRRSENSNSLFPWLETFEPEIVRVDIGSIKNVQSNVPANDALEPLAEFDRKRNYIEPKSNLFRSHINAKLPQPDQSLDYKFSALPAFVDNTCAPPRVANPEVFEPFPVAIRDKQFGSRPNDQLPHAVRLCTNMEVTIDENELNRHSINIDSIGVAGGAISDY